MTASSGWLAFEEEGQRGPFFEKRGVSYGEFDFMAYLHGYRNQITPGGLHLLRYQS